LKYAKFVFLDTAYVYALINTRDKWHEKAVAWQERLAKERKPLLSTEFVLVEIADGLNYSRRRLNFIRNERTKDGDSQTAPRSL